LFELLLDELNDERFDCQSEKLESTCATFSSVEKIVSNKVAIFCWTDKI